MMRLLLKNKTGSRDREPVFCLLLSAYCLLVTNPGNDLLSHAATRAVPWALEGLTSVFGMGTGVAPPV
jgi:hypothetical protein